MTHGFPAMNLTAFRRPPARGKGKLLTTCCPFLPPFEGILDNSRWWQDRWPTNYEPTVLVEEGFTPALWFQVQNFLQIRDRSAPEIGFNLLER
jgi:hypothetical protein